MLLGSMLAQHHESPSRVSLTLLVTTEIEGREAVVADSQLLGGRVCGRLQDGDTVVLQHVQQRRLAGIVQTEEQELGVLIEKTQRGQDIVNYRTRREISKLHLVPRDTHLDHKQAGTAAQPSHESGSESE